MIVRSFEVRERCQNLLCQIGEDVDKKLVSLQKNGWKIINVYPLACKEYRYPSYYDSLVYIIIAQYNDEGDNNNEC